MNIEAFNTDTLRKLVRNLQDENKKLKEDFKRDLEECTEITKETYAKRSKFTKLRESFSRLLSPLL